MKELA